MLLSQKALLNQRAIQFVEICWLSSLWKLFIYSEASEAGSLRPFTCSEAGGSARHSAPFSLRPRSVLLLCGYRANLCTRETKLFRRTMDTSSKMETNLGPFLFSGHVCSLLGFTLECLTIPVHDAKWLGFAP